MAKTKKTSTNTPTDLKNTLQINGTTYNITATKADIATKVQAALTITQSKVDNVEPVVFDGEDPKSVSVVPAEGGEFTGPILVPGLDTNYPDQVLNKTDTKNLIDEIVAALKGLPNHVWDGEKLIPELDPENPDNYKALKIISAEDTNDYEAFEATAESKEYPYIFICKDTGDIWLKTIGQEPVNITEKIKNQVKNSLIGNTQVPDNVDVEELTLSFLYNELKELSDLLTTNSVELDNLVQLVSDKVAELLGKPTDSSASITIYGTRNYVEELSDNLTNNFNAAIMKITNGTTAVGHSDKIKVQTADGKTKYYSTIYFGSSAPASSLGNDGDIYIRIP